MSLMPFVPSRFSEAPSRDHARKGFTLIELLVVIAIIAILIALLVPAVQKVREAAARVQCTNNLKQLGLALHAYHDTYKKFPNGSNVPASAPYGFGWGAHILPFIEQSNLHAKFDFTLTAPNDGYNKGVNLSSAANLLSVFLCPSNPQVELVEVNVVGAQDIAITHYAGSCCSTARIAAGRPITNGNGVFFRGQIAMRDITDGTSNTIFVGEVVGNGPGSFKGFWWSTWNIMDTQNGINYVRRQAGYPATVPGGVTDIVAHSFAGFHPGGVNFLLGDGSVRFVADSVQQQTLNNLTTRAGGEVVGDF